MPDAISYTVTFVLAKKSASDINRLMGFLPNAKNIRVLSDDKAVEIDSTHQSAKALQTVLGAEIAEANIKADFCVQPSGDRRKGLLICDMDSTLIGQECIDELADFAGVKDRVSAITERAMRGDIDFEGALTERVSLLKGLPLAALQTCFEERISLNPGAKTLAKTMRSNGAKTVIVSGGFTFFTSRVAELAGFHAHQANTLIEDETALTGAVGHPILGRDAKREALEAHSASCGGPANALAIGDGANDLAMITAASLGIAYRAKPLVAAAAHCAINHTDLTSALYFQGYSDAEFIT